MLLLPADQFAALQNTAESIARLDLSGMRTHLLDAIHKRIDPPVEGFERQGCNQVRPLRHGKSTHQGKHAVGTHKLRTVQQRQSLFTHQAHRLPGKLVQDTDCLPLLPFIIHISHSDKRKEKIRQRSQVARRTKRTTVIDDREHVIIKEIKDTLHRYHLHAAMPQRQSMRLQQHHQADNHRAHLIPHATGMAFHQILLQGAEFIRRDILITQGTKACRDAVKRLALCLDLPVQIIAATLDTFLHFRGQFQLHISGQYLFDTFERQRFRPHIMYISHNVLLSIFNFQLSIAPASNPATSFLSGSLRIRGNPLSPTSV